MRDQKLERIKISRLHTLAANYDLPVLDGSCMALSILVHAYGDNAIEKIWDEAERDGKVFFEKLIFLQTQMQNRVPEIPFDLDKFLHLGCDVKIPPLNKIDISTGFGVAYTVGSLGDHIIDIRRNEDNSYNYFDSILNEIYKGDLQSIFSKIKSLPAKINKLHNFRIQSLDLYNCSALFDYPLTVVSVIEFKRFKVLKYLVEEKGADVNIPSNNGYHPLYLAAEQNIEVVEYLIKEKANINQINPDGRTALLSAANKGKMDIIKFLLTNGADENILTYDGKTYKDLYKEWCEKDIEKSLSDISYSERQSYLTEALFKALSDNDVIMVNALLDHDAKVNSSNEKGITPLLLCASQGNFSMMKLLLKKGAGEYILTQDKKSYKDLYEEWCKQDTENLLIENASDPSKIKSILQNGLYCSITGEDETKSKVLLEKGANVDHIYFNGFTCLHFAAHFGHFSSMKLLLSNGADENVCTRNNKTYIDLYKVWCDTNVKKLLSDNNGDITKQENNLDIEVLKAVILDDVILLEALQANGVDFNTFNIQSSSILTFKISNNADFKLIKFLISRGAKVEVENLSNLDLDKVILSYIFKSFIIQNVEANTHNDRAL